MPCVAVIHRNHGTGGYGQELEEFLSQVGDGFVKRADFLLRLRRQRQLAIFVLHSGENGLHSVVILLGDGIELVVVAAGATGGKAEEGGARGIDHVIEFVHALHDAQLRVLALHGIERSRDEEAGADVRAEHVPGDLPADELVVGLVAV